MIEIMRDVYLEYVRERNVFWRCGDNSLTFLGSEIVVLYGLSGTRFSAFSRPFYEPEFLFRAEF